MLPRGADAVIMLEYSRHAGERPAGDRHVELTRPAAPLDNVIAKGEDAQQGEKILPAGRVLRPQEIGLLAALGQEVVKVRQKPKIAVISSGDEIVPPSARPLPGQVRDINTYSLTAVIQAAGGESRSFGIVGDNEIAIATKVREALEWADALLLSGGSSAGRRDCTRTIFSSLRGVEILAHGVACSPGKPLIVAKRDQQFLWGLPGHAASALVCAEVFIRPFIRRLLGQEEPHSGTSALRAVLTRPIVSAQGRRDYIRVRLDLSSMDNESPTAQPLMGKSGLITTLVEADALLICPEDREGLDEGAIVTVHLLL
jgi:molybdopterin molybdotransferase